MNNKLKPTSSMPREPKHPQVADGHNMKQDAAFARYFDLYNMAPVGYCTVNDKGLILEANFTVSTLLGIPRGKLVKQILTRFILKEDQEIYYLHSKKLFDTGEPHTCELRMLKKDDSVFWAHLVATAANDEDGMTVCRIVMSDITGLKQAESEKETALEALRKSEKYFKEITENSSDIIIITDKNGDIKYCSRSLERFTGYKPEEITGKSAFNFIHPDDVERAVNDFDKAIRAKDTNLIPNTFRILHKNGSEVYLDGMGKNLLDNQDIAGFVMNVRDITESKKAEKKLITSEEKFRILAESSSFAIMMHQGDLWIYANRAAEEISGYTEKELCGMHFWDIVHPDYRDMVKQSGYNRQQGKVLPRAYEFKIITKTGEEKWVSLTGNPIQYEDKSTALISVTDITERKIAEVALTESEIKYRRIFESFEDLYYQTDAKGILRVLSPSLYRLTGWYPDELIGKPISDIYVRPKDRGEFLAELSTKGFLRDYEVFLKRKDETYVYASLAASILTGPDGNLSGIAGTLRDITERKQAEFQREAALEALRKSEQQYWELSIIDDLTQLYNSRHFYAQLGKEIERSNRYGQPLTLLLLDLDKFKDFNDTYGHVQGDYVLSRLGRAIKRSLRETDSAYRYGGEEFTIMLPMTTTGEGITTAKRIQKELRKENFSPAPDQEVYLTVSIGLAQYKPAEEMKAFVQRVDQLMYKGKKSGRDKICSDDGILL
jgi:diguanylate cyclase (GGDEF)-like protein/PAS domain S-box-containing protein